MKTIRCAFCVAYALFCADGSAFAAASNEHPAKEIIVRFKHGTLSESRKLSVLARCGAGRITASYKNIFKIVEVPEGTMDEKLSALLKMPEIAYAEPNYTVRALSFPDDTYYGLQWNFSLINLEQAWAVSAGQGVTVAVLDSGVSPYGRDGFGTRLLPGYNAFLNREARWEDFNYHGTHVAGTIGQETNNGIGVAGIACSAGILPVKVLNRAGFGTIAAVASGIRWAADHGARIINMSLGDSESSQTLYDAVTYAYGRGVVLVAAAGNESGASELAPVSYPAAYEQVIAVGSIGYGGERAYYSNGGPELDLVAPGGDTSSDADNDGHVDGILQETFFEYLGFVRYALGWNYFFLQGTSMASPHAAGVAALVCSLHPDWGPDEVREALTTTAVDLGAPGRDDSYGYGLIDAAAAVAY